MKSIREIAKLSGVSTATISRYINKSGYISDKTVEKIEKVLAENEYHPNKLTTAIINGRSTDIALIVQNIMNPFFAQLVDEIESLIENTEYNLIICNCKGNVEKEKMYYKNLLEKRIAGILVINTNDEHIYANKAVPIIGIEKRILDFPKVAISNQQALLKIFDNVEFGQSHILMVKGQENSHSSNLRTKYFKQLATANNCTYDIYQIADTPQALKNKSEIDYFKYTSIFCWTDVVAHKIYSEIAQTDLKVPDDIQLIGFDGLSINTIFPYKLTTIDQNIRNIGSTSINNLIKCINNEYVADIYLKCDIVVGTTTREKRS